MAGAAHGGAEEGDLPAIGVHSGARQASDSSVRRVAVRLFSATVQMAPPVQRQRSSLRSETKAM